MGISFPVLMMHTRMGYGYRVFDQTMTTNDIDKFNFNTNTAAISVASGGNGENGRAACNSLAKGYLFGGTEPFSSPNSKIRAIPFSTDTSSVLAATLAVTIYQTTSVNSASNGYALGGRAGSGYTFSTEVQGVVFASDTLHNPSATLPVAMSRGAGVHSPDKGYVMGGESSAGVKSAEIQGIQFSNDTAINPSATLPAARYDGSGVNSPTRGYMFGGLDTAPSTAIEALTWSDETRQTLSATLQYAAVTNAAIQDLARGLTDYSVGMTSDVHGILFSTEAQTSFSLSVLYNGSSNTLGYQSGAL